MEKETLAERSKPQLTVGTIGAAGAGKSTLTAALTAVKSANRLYTHLDSPGGADYAKSLIVGAAQMDAAVLVVSLPDGPNTQTREHLLLARQVGVRHIVVFLNKADLVDDAEILDLVELEVRELLSAYQYPGDHVPVVVGSALKALEGDTSPIGVPAVAKLVETMDRYIPLPQHDVDKPFLMAVDDVFAIADRGTIVTGQIERGTVKVGDEVEIVGLRSTARTTIAGVEMFRKLLDQGRAGENVGLLLRGIEKAQVERGQVICKPGTVRADTRFEAEVYMFDAEGGGRDSAIFMGYRPQFYFRTTDVAGVVELPPGVEMVMPGDRVTMTVELIAPIGLETGLHFSIREESKDVGAGVISAVGTRSVVALMAKDVREPGRVFRAGSGDDYRRGAVEDLIRNPRRLPIWIDDSAERRVSLLFATTRTPSELPEEFFSGERADTPSYGKANVRIPEERRLGEIKLPFELKLFSFSLYKQSADPRKHFILQGCEILTKRDWLDVVSSSGQKEALIFVHGFRVGFLEGIYRCAQIAWDIGYRGIPILFSWASRGTVLNYEYDRNSALIARAPFVDLLLALGKAGIEKVHVLAHSMGNFAVLDALANHDHVGQPLPLGEVLMAAPDVDSDQYKGLAPKVRAVVKGMTLYASSADKALILSKTIAGRVPRAGDVPPGGPILVDRVDAIDVTAVGDDVFGLNHGVFAKEKSILNDVKLLLSLGLRPPADRLTEIRGMPVGQSPSKWWRYVL